MISRKRVYVDQGIYIILNNGKVAKNSFEVAKRRKFHKLGKAVKLFKVLYDNWNTVYMYHTKEGYMVEFKAYTDTLEEAISLRNQVESILGVLEDEE